MGLVKYKNIAHGKFIFECQCTDSIVSKNSSVECHCQKQGWVSETRIIIYFS